MYVPEHFRATRPEALQALMRARPLATLVTLSANGFDANHIPLHWSPQPAPWGTLRGHVARANSLWRQMAPGAEALAIFHGPQAYVTPSWYPAKAEHGRVVPTWNYAVVHAHGAIRVVDDAVWLRAQLEALTAASEAGRAEPWHVTDAPPEFVERLIAGIVGIEMAVSRIEGKWKLSQNQSPANRAGVVRGLRAEGGADALAMAAWIEEAGDPG